MILVAREKSKVKLALAFPTNAPIVVVNEIIDIYLIIFIKIMRTKQICIISQCFTC